MNYINLTPHSIVLNDGRSFPPSGTIARVSTSFTEIIEDVCQTTWGEVEGLPAPVEGTMYVVSALVLGAVNGRSDVVAPATGHPQAVRNDKGHIISVPCFVKN